MYRYSSTFQGNMQQKRSQQRIQFLTIALIVLLVICVALSVVCILRGSTNGNIQEEVNARITQDLSNAITLVNRMDRTATSRTISDIGRVRQYIYSMDQMNRLCYSVSGTRLISDDVFTVLYSDVDNFDSITQGAKSSTMDAQATLLTHLQNLQSVISR